jgi:hypothetical protein
LVSIIGVSRKPDSVIQVVPVISPLPFSLCQWAYSGFFFLPLGKIAVTPVRIGPAPNSWFPDPEIRVVWPTLTPDTSVIALKVPVVPSKGIPKSLALGFWPKIVMVMNSIQKEAEIRISSF